MFIWRWWNKSIPYDSIPAFALTLTCWVTLIQLTITRLLVLKKLKAKIKLKLGHCPWQSCFFSFSQKKYQNRYSCYGENTYTSIHEFITFFVINVCKIIWMGNSVSEWTPKCLSKVLFLYFVCLKNIMFFFGW